MIGGLAESRYLSMDKLKTRGVLLAYKNVSIVEGTVYNKGNLFVLSFIFAMYKYDNITYTSMYIIGKEPRGTMKVYVKDYLKYLSFNKRILE